MAEKKNNNNNHLVIMSPLLVIPLLDQTIKFFIALPLVRRLRTRNIMMRTRSLSSEIIIRFVSSVLLIEGQYRTRVKLLLAIIIGLWLMSILPTIVLSTMIVY